MFCAERRREGGGVTKPIPLFARRILIVEDDPFVASLMSAALTNEGLTAAIAKSATEAKRRVASFDPDLVLVDIDLGDGPNGIDFVSMLCRTRPDIAAIVLSKHPDHSSAGARGWSLPDTVSYLRKSLVHDTHALVDAIDDVLRGSTIRWHHDRTEEAVFNLLTHVQRETLHMMSLGLSNSEIARRRDVSVSAVEQRVGEIFTAFGIKGDQSLAPRVEAVRRYMVAGGIPLPQP